MKINLRAYLLSVCLLSGCLSGMVTTMGKMWLVLVTLKPISSLLSDPFFYLCGLSVFFCVWSSVVNLNATIRLYSQLLVMPTYECCIIIGTFVSGGLVMGEFSYYSMHQLSFIFIGSCIAISGIMYKVIALEVDDVQKQPDFQNEDCVLDFNEGKKRRFEEMIKFILTQKVEPKKDFENNSSIKESLLSANITDRSQQ